MYKITHGSFIVAIESGTETLDLLNRKVVLVRHNYGDNGEKKFSLPGGRIDHGERPEQAALRELAEETGLKLTKECSSLGVFMSRKNPGTLSFLFKTIYIGIPKIIDTNEIFEVRVVTIKDALRLDLYPGQKILLAAYVSLNDQGYIIDWLSNPNNPLISKL